jgi:hypothetical protein
VAMLLSRPLYTPSMHNCQPCCAARIIRNVARKECSRRFGPGSEQGKKAVDTSLLTGFRLLWSDRLAAVPLIPDACHGMGEPYAT